MITGILIALPDEVSTLTAKKIKKGECVFLNKDTLITLSGAGPDNAELASQLLIQQGANRLISWGCAAALDPDLNPGDLVLPESLLSAEKQPISIQSTWLEYLTKQFQTLHPVSGTLTESDSIVASSQAKKAIYTNSNAIALDMESIAVAKVAQKNNLPIVVIRCIADPVNMSLPKAVSHALNDQGDVILSKLLAYLLTHPSELPSLIKLGIHFNTAKNKLKLVAKQLDIINGFEQQSNNQ